MSVRISRRTGLETAFSFSSKRSWVLAGIVMERYIYRQIPIYTPASCGFRGSGVCVKYRKKESSRFLKKAAQKLSLNWASGGETARAQFKKVFCFFFSKKKRFLFSVP